MWCLKKQRVHQPSVWKKRCAANSGGHVNRQLYASCSVRLAVYVAR